MMTGEPERIRPELDAELIRMVCLIGLGLVALFTVTIFSALVPLRPLEADWQLTIAGALLGNSGLALSGIALVATASALVPQDRLARRWLRRFRQLSLAACLGYLLLIPVQISALIRRGVLSEIPTTREIAALTEIKARASFSQTLPELAWVVRSLPGSPVLPTSTPRPLNRVREQVVSSIGISIQDLRQRQLRERQKRQLAELGTMISGTLLSLIYAGLFAAIGQAHPLRPSVLVGLLLAWRSRREGMAQSHTLQLQKKAERRQLDSGAKAIHQIYRQAEQAQRELRAEQAEASPVRSGWPWPVRWLHRRSPPLGEFLTRQDDYLARISPAEVPGGGENGGEEKIPKP